eukprot:m.208397 g.208397  ORF g.208397 m.208397 type:complete len:473 (-) comp33004_c6_seq1:261-1679(-)
MGTSAVNKISSNNSSNDDNSSGTYINNVNNNGIRVGYRQGNLFEEDVIMPKFSFTNLLSRISKFEKKVQKGRKKKELMEKKQTKAENQLKTKQHKKALTWFVEEESTVGSAMDVDGDWSLLPWFHGFLSQDDATVLLGSRVAGTYLVALSDFRRYRLSIARDDGCGHYNIDAGTAYYIESNPNNVFESLNELVEYLKTNECAEIDQNGDQLLMECPKVDARPGLQMLEMEHNTFTAVAPVLSPSLCWFGGSMSWQDAKTLLITSSPQTFLVRRYHQDKYALVLRRVAQPIVKHFRINYRENSWSLANNSRTFDTINDLVQYFQSNGLDQFASLKSFKAVLGAKIVQSIKSKQFPSAQKHGGWDFETGCRITGLNVDATKKKLEAAGLKSLGNQQIPTAYCILGTALVLHYLEMYMDAVDTKGKELIAQACASANEFLIRSENESPFLFRQLKSGNSWKYTGTALLPLYLPVN